MDLQRFVGRQWGLALPKRLDELVPRYDVIRVQQQNRKQGTLLRAPEIQDVPARKHLKRAEDPKLHATCLRFRFRRCLAKRR
jgi:hypothetical protein